MKQTDVSLVLRNVRKRLTPPERWAQGDFAFTARRKHCGIASPRAVCWCIDGALLLETGCAPHDLDTSVPLTGLYRLACKAITSTLGRADFSVWQDHRLRTHEHVLHLLDTTIARVEREAAR